MKADAVDPTAICLDCRTSLRPGEPCDGGRRHRTTSLSDPAGRERLLSEVWGSPSVRRRAMQLAKAGGAGAVMGGVAEGCAVGCDPCVLAEGAAEPSILLVVLAAAAVGMGIYYLVAKIVEWRRQRRNELRPRGALLKPRVHGSVHQGLVSTSGDDRAVASGITLRRKRFIGSSVMLRYAASYGFTVQLEDGRALQIPPGRIRLEGPASRSGRPGLAEVEGLLRRLDPLRASESEDEDFDPIPYDRAEELVLLPGDRVEVIGVLEPVVDTGSEEAATYREPAPAVLAPIGVPLVRLAF